MRAGLLRAFSEINAAERVGFFQPALSSLLHPTAFQSTPLLLNATTFNSVQRWNNAMLRSASVASALFGPFPDDTPAAERFVSYPSPPAAAATLDGFTPNATIDSLSAGALFATAT